MTKGISLKTIKLLEQGTVEEKEVLLNNRPYYMSYLTIPEQLYFINQDVDKFYKYCDSDIKDFMMDAFPEYYSAYATKEELENYVDCGLLDPGYLEGSLEPIYMDENTTAKTIMSYALFAGIREDIEKEYPEEFANIEPEPYR